MKPDLVHAGSVEELREAERKVVQVGRAPVLVLWHAGAFHALDNRCPHMGFPLHQGDVHDGLLDCHWHHARFDVTCGATLDPWADDAPSYGVIVEEGQVYVDPARPARDPEIHGQARLTRGIEENLRLVIAKAVLELENGGVDSTETLATAAAFGATERKEGWQPGLSILSAMANVLPVLRAEDQPRALVHACKRIAEEIADHAPRRPLTALDATDRDAAGLRAWFRETVEVRDAQGAERVLATIVREHGLAAALDAVLAACTDHRYSDLGHTLDYTLKCAELCDAIPGRTELHARLFTSLVPQLVGMERMEETSAWRRPVDVAALVEAASARLEGVWRAAGPGGGEVDEEALVEILLAEEPPRAVDALLERLAAGADPVALAEAVVLAATHRVLRFGTANELADWNTVHHTLTYANAVAEGLRRVPSPELFRGVLDGAMSVYLDRFLNVPPAALPEPVEGEPDALAADLLVAYDGRSNVEEATRLAWSFLAAGGKPERLLATLGRAILREDADFHELQELELAWRRLARRGDSLPARLALTAAARWIAALYPTPRGAEQTFDIARRLERGENLHA